MKRFVVLLFVAVMALGLSGTAFADMLTVGGVDNAIGKKEALSIALKDAGLSKAKICKVEIEQGKKCVEVEFTRKSNGTEYSYDIAKSDGGIVEKNVEYKYKHNYSKAKIGKKAALKKVAKHSGVKLSIVKKGSCTYKYRKHEGKYEIVFRYKGYRYEYELLAPTGKVVEWEMERVRK